MLGLDSNLSVFLLPVTDLIGSTAIESAKNTTLLNTVAHRNACSTDTSSTVC